MKVVGYPYEFCLRNNSAAGSVSGNTQVWSTVILFTIRLLLH